MIIYKIQGGQGIKYFNGHTVNQNKIVVVPRNWFGESSGLNQSDIIPNKWIVAYLHD